MSQEPATSLWARTGTELAELLGEPSRPSITRSKAALRWLWRQNPPPRTLPERMEGITPRMWQRLLETSYLDALTVTSSRKATDETVKLLIESRGTPYETVMIPGRGRVTVCVSSQSGCTRDCRFCATANLGFQRNLEASEMVAQVALAACYAPADRPLRNVVFMGMGEPLDNLEQVVRAVEVLTDPYGAGLAPSHITVSTSGVLPRMAEFLDKCPAELAISLNGSMEVQRRQVMPIDKRWPLSSLISFIRDHGSRRLFFIEYILMGGFNDHSDDAKRVAALLAGLNVRVNLIPFNPHPGTLYQRSSHVAVNAFFQILCQAGIRTMIRASRGDDISAACGQLRRALDVATSLEAATGG